MHANLFGVALLLAYLPISLVQGESFAGIANSIQKRSPFPNPFDRVFVETKKEGGSNVDPKSFYATPIEPASPGKRSLFPRQNICPVGDYECSNGLGCCPTTSNCVVIGGTPGCCPKGKFCDTIGGCSSGFYECPDGGCCQIGYTCSGGACYPPSSSSIPPASPSTKPCPSGSFRCQDSSGGCCPNGYVCNPDGKTCGKGTGGGGGSIGISSVVTTSVSANSPTRTTGLKFSTDTSTDVPFIQFDTTTVTSTTSSTTKKTSTTPTRLTTTLIATAAAAQQPADYRMVVGMVGGALGFVFN